MKKNKVVAIRKDLEEKKVMLNARLVQLKAEDPFTDTDRVNDNAAVDDDAAEETGHERIEVLEKLTQNEIAVIDATLAQMDAGTYGKCEKCGREIGEKRLEVVPSSTVCVACLGE